ncbi:MAG: aminoacyl-histidine dipeptidase [Bacteroidales bacterium]|nr:aminoacyl-histidine dipeptidase [Bacteroidales bacterium]MCF0211950.1 aminoacyl-histidine dipeptidase [Bacteroidales bacterium]
MQKELENLQPASVWRYFGEIMNIPRPSKHEEKISAYLQQKGREMGYETLSDALGNVLIRKPAHPGYENSPKVCLQAHTDMVCEKNSTKQFDFLTDAIQPVLDGEWLTADGTTLGADDGIGVAAILAILEDKTIEHGPLEALFTVDEETGLTGAEGLCPNWLQSEMLLNFDDEDEGEFCIGCAGGIDTTVAIDYQRVPVERESRAFQLHVLGLKGGHSGDDINKGLGCANKMLTRLLWRASEKLGLRLASIDGGNLRNAIAREAVAVVTVPNANEGDFRQMVSTMAEAIRFEFRSTEPDLQIKLDTIDMPATLIDKDTQDNLLNALYACAHGVLAMSREIPNFVETSTNLASIKMDAHQIHIATSQRSSVESAKHAAAEKIEATFRMIGAHVSHGDGYPGWTPNPDSKVLRVAVDVYRRLHQREPVVRAIHAGLECGLIGEKYPKMDMISFGPTLRGVHSPDERIEIKTVQMFWDTTLELLRCLK